MANEPYEIKINGTKIKSPKPGGFTINRYNLTEAGRTADGTMHMDLIAKKREFNFNYEVISSKELDKILDLIWEPNEVFFTLEYVENGKRRTAAVYPGAIPTEYYRGGDNVSSVWYWRGIEFNLIEQ